MASSSASSLPGSVITVASSAAAAALSGGSAGAGAGATGSPCAACKFLRRKCQPDCVFAPYFPPDNPQKFVHVHRVFGASNVTKLLHELSPFQREDAVNSLAYEADMRLRDPVYGCVGVISVLQHQLRQLQQDLSRARFELAKYQQQAAAAAAAAADFGGSANNNCTQNFINISHHHSTTAIGAGVVGVGGGFGHGHDQFAAVQMLARSYEGDSGAIARLSVNGGSGYDFGYSSAMGGVGGPVSGLGPFLKPGTAGGDERHTAAQ
ncbi:LOB domain-containing protein 6 [Brachypodium distachyon]|uniref:LOB domain-containing protein n=1 Tax=Brachypodium distachyon TaxID=15368 RepID=I1HJD8_BRADI|nr:LOB domain-containing protein 6 [Brachypodium distachyon]XP_010231373.1 LOB domain-containing protein 6 [Brachypodium distachyon]XP_024314121.1 LOB domain-containing protein 6 [Brachypodium distachyon]XP_024314122.1 LOB domain-containing protein 6 [Brachypodium distachyon]KQK06240.1 hypothetical protein BRADI_2g25270v3 [Brachypodium distachyon]KQK06241.1 hypothetical protein BRADI_2g25270v3 [Brachypodium distachyon]|eukprot:XP_003568446.1 LOB domain-containing protein 6 [Brachypodium distachyon]